ncbi:MAG: oligosaccharide flippase family protein [Actinomycetota bacterium]|nr:oligosaccharide flippase family protein [Actinomycetota bacterium]
MSAPEVAPATGDRSGLVPIIRGASVALLGSVIGGGFGFAFSVVMAHLLDKSDFGLFVLALSFVTAGAWLGIAGADYATIRYVAAADTPGGKRGAMRTTFTLVTAFSIALSVLLFVLAEPIAVHVLGEPRFTNVLRALPLVLPLTVMAQMFSAGLSGLEHARGELARKVAEQGGRIAFASLFVLLGLGVAGAVLGMALAGALAAVVVGSLLLRSLPRGGKTQPLESRKVLAFSWPQTVAGAASRIWEIANVAILARYEDARTVALFGAALAIAQLPQMVYNSFAFRFSPTISRLWESRQLAELHDLLRGVTRWVSIFSVPLYAVAIALPASLLHVYGDGYRPAALALALLAAASLLNSLAGPVEWTLIMTGRVKLEMLVNVTTVLFVIGLALVLTPRFGLVGAAIAFFVHYVLVNALKAYFVHRALRMHTYSAGLLRPIGAAAVAALVAVPLERGTALGDSLAGGAVLGVLLIACYVLVLLRGFGISKSDRHALGLALRRSA